MCICIYIYIGTHTHTCILDPFVSFVWPFNRFCLASMAKGHYRDRSYSSADIDEQPWNLV